MWLRFRGLAVLLLSIGFLWWPRVRPQSDMRPARALDSVLQDYAYRAFVNPRTGVPFDGTVPWNLTGIRISAMRLRSGSLFRRGVAMYKEFRIPVGVRETPYVKRLVLVYQNLGNLSATYYPLRGYRYLAPVLGLLAYDALNLSAKQLPELDIRAYKQAITIEFGQVRPVPDGSVARCVSFNLRGQANFTNVVSGNRCLTYKQGHFSIVVNSTASPPAPPPNKTRVWILVGCVVGGVALLAAGLVAWVRKYRKRKRMRKMERAADAGEALNMSMVGGTRAPSAAGTRTQPTLETEYEYVP